MIIDIIYARFWNYLINWLQYYENEVNGEHFIILNK